MNILRKILWWLTVNISHGRFVTGDWDWVSSSPWVHKQGKVSHLLLSSSFPFVYKFVFCLQKSDWATTSWLMWSAQVWTLSVKKNCRECIFYYSPHITCRLDLLCVVIVVRVSSLSRAKIWILNKCEPQVSAWHLTCTLKLSFFQTCRSFEDSKTKREALHIIFLSTAAFVLEGRVWILWSWIVWHTYAQPVCYL